MLSSVMKCLVMDRQINIHHDLDKQRLKDIQIYCMYILQSTCYSLIQMTTKHNWNKDASHKIVSISYLTV